MFVPSETSAMSFLNYFYDYGSPGFQKNGKIGIKFTDKLAKYLYLCRKMKR